MSHCLDPFIPIWYSPFVLFLYILCFIFMWWLHYWVGCSIVLIHKICFCKNKNNLLFPSICGCKEFKSFTHLLIFLLSSHCSCMWAVSKLTRLLILLSFLQKCILPMPSSATLHHHVKSFSFIPFSLATAQVAGGCILALLLCFGLFKTPVCICFVCLACT